MRKKIIITGGTGLIGSRLTTELVTRDYLVTIFTRYRSKGKIYIPSVDYVQWDYHKPGDWQNQFEDVFAVIHLAGANLAKKRFTKAYKNTVKDSRIISTQNIVKAISEAKIKPEVLISASGINYYGESGDDILTEDSLPGKDFLAEVCGKWENEAAKVEEEGVRRVSIRTSPVLSLQDGMLKTLYPLFIIYLGASLGSGRQWFSWIHIDDIIRTYIYALENENLSGSVNASSPHPVLMNDFAERFGNAIHRQVFFRVPKFVLKSIKGEAADFITASMRVIPARLKKWGFVFKFPELHSALDDIVRNKK